MIINSFQPIKNAKKDSFSMILQTLRNRFQQCQKLINVCWASTLFSISQQHCKAKKSNDHRLCLKIDQTRKDLSITNLCVSVQHFDSFSGDEQVHLCHHLRVFILALLNKEHCFTQTFYVSAHQSHIATFRLIVKNADTFRSSRKSTQQLHHVVKQLIYCTANTA